MPTYDSSKSPARPSGGRRQTMRVVKDGDEGMVLVYESEAATIGGPRTLVFESGNGRIRLQEYPQEWRTMDDRELLALFEH